MPRWHGRRSRAPAGRVHEWDEGTVVPKRRSLVLRANELTAACEGRLITGNPEAQLAGFAIDSRRVHAGDLFIAVRGMRFDGHQFVAEAVHNGAAGVVVSDASSAGLDPGDRGWAVGSRRGRHNSCPAAVGQLRSSTVARARGRDHWKRWQDHDQGNDRDPSGRFVRRVSERRQLEQPHWRAVVAA